MAVLQRHGNFHAKTAEGTLNARTFRTSADRQVTLSEFVLYAVRTIELPGAIVVNDRLARVDCVHVLACTYNLPSHAQIQNTGNGNSSVKNLPPGNWDFDDVNSWSEGPVSTTRRHSEMSTVDDIEGSTSKDSGKRCKRGRGGKFPQRSPPDKVPKVGDNPEVTSSSTSEAEKPKCANVSCTRGRRRKYKPTKAEFLSIPGHSEEPSSTTTAEFAGDEPKGMPVSTENLPVDKSPPAAPSPDSAKSALDIADGPDTSQQLSPQLESVLNAALERSTESEARSHEERQSEFFQNYQQLQSQCKMTQTEAFSEDTASSPDVDSKSDDGNENDDDDSHDDPNLEDGAGKKEDPGGNRDGNSDDSSRKEDPNSNNECDSRCDGGDIGKGNSDDKSGGKSTDYSKGDSGDSKCIEGIHRNDETYEKNEARLSDPDDGGSNDQSKREEMHSNGTQANPATMDNHDQVSTEGFGMSGESDTTFVDTCIKQVENHVDGEDGNTNCVASNYDKSSSEDGDRGFNNKDVNNFNNIGSNNGNNDGNNNSNHTSNKNENNDNEYRGVFESISDDDSSSGGDFDEEEVPKETAVASPPPEPLWLPEVKVPQLPPALVCSLAVSPPRPVQHGLPQHTHPFQGALPQDLPRQEIFPFELRNPLLSPFGHSEQGLYPQDDSPKGTPSPFPGLPPQDQQGVGPLDGARQDVFPSCGPSQEIVPACLSSQGAHTQGDLSALPQGPPLQGLIPQELAEDLHDITLHSLFCEAPLPPFPYRLMDFMDITEEVDLLGLFE